MEFDENGWAFVYKFYEQIYDRIEKRNILIPAYRCVHRDSNEIKPGWIVSNREKKELGKDPLDIDYLSNVICVNRGIHVCLNKYCTGSYMKSCDRIVKLKVHRSQFIARKGNRAIFMKVFLSKEEHRKALAR